MSSATSSLTLFAGTDGWTVIVSGEVTSVDNGVKLLKASYGTLARMIGWMIKSWFATSSVWPSAGAFAALPVPIVLPPPGRFSTTNVPPSDSVSFCARMRAMMSFGPPGA